MNINSEQKEIGKFNLEMKRELEKLQIIQIQSLINTFYQLVILGLINIISFYFRKEYLPQGGRSLTICNKIFRNE